MEAVQQLPIWERITNECTADYKFSGLEKRNYKFSGKCKSGRPRAQTSEAFTREYIQIFKSSTPILETSPDSIT
jgi:hypothetical protein